MFSFSARSLLLWFDVTHALLKLTGLTLLLITGLMVLVEFGVGGFIKQLLPLTALTLVVLLTPQIRRGRQAFVAIGLFLTLALINFDSEWQSITEEGLRKAAFICAFFCALTSLRSAAQASTAIQNAGQFLAKQPPGRRYLALTFGGQMFALMLNYGAIALLGSLTTDSAKNEPNPEIRRHRTRRMLLAIQRGFISVLPWSPLSFAVAITIALVPGTSWAGALLPGIVTSVLMAGTGWVLDAIFKPQITGQIGPRVRPEGGWFLMLPLVLLLAIIFGCIIVLFFLTGIRVVGLVILIVPSVAFVWVMLQTRGAERGFDLSSRLAQYTFVELPSFRGEVILLMMAGYIGTVGAALLQPTFGKLGLDLSALPTWVLLVSFVWTIPLAGQVGMNPILAVTLLSPLIPSAETLGVSPTAIIVAITSGWALSAVTSPFTATTLLIGSFGNVSARHVGLRWNGVYFLVTAFILSVWVVVFSNLPY